jgi:hypothetical protein
MEVKIKIDSRSEDGKTLLNYLQNLSYVKILEKDNSPYDPEFVKEIQTRSKSKNLITIKDSEGILESIL